MTFNFYSYNPKQKAFRDLAQQVLKNYLASFDVNPDKLEYWPIRDLLQQIEGSLFPEDETKSSNKVQAINDLRAFSREVKEGGGKISIYANPALVQAVIDATGITYYAPALGDLRGYYIPASNALLGLKESKDFIDWFNENMRLLAEEGNGNTLNGEAAKNIKI